MKTLTLFFDGACVVCHREVSHYLKHDKSELIKPIDISLVNFKAETFGLDQKQVNLHMHAMDSSGTVFKGVDSFIEIWRRIPRYEFLIPLFENRALRPLINLGYEFFARKIRPRLPKRNCSDGKCALN